MLKIEKEKEIQGFEKTHYKAKETKNKKDELILRKLRVQRHRIAWGKSTKVEKRYLEEEILQL